MACLGLTSLLIGKAAEMLQERDQLKARARDEAAALEARKNKVTVTVDLLGRQVPSAEAMSLVYCQDVAVCFKARCETHQLYGAHVCAALCGQVSTADMSIFTYFCVSECPTVALTPILGFRY